MKASQLIKLLNNILEKSGDIDINVQVTINGVESHQLIEGVQYVYDGEATTVILVPIIN